MISKKLRCMRPAATSVLITLLCSGSAFAQIVAKEADKKIDVWLDADTATGVPGRDVDDGLAIIQAFNSPELKIHGLSVVFGNTSLEKAIPIAEELATRFGPPGLIVAPGAADASDLTESNAAVEAMAAALAETPMHIQALGPVTNVAALLKQHPDLESQILSVIMVAGRRPGQEFRNTPKQPLPHKDFNFESDPEGMQVLLDSSVPLVLAPWEVSSHIWITSEDLDWLATQSEAGEYIAQKSRFWLGLWQKGMGADGFNPFDTLAIGWLTHPELFEHFEANSWIEEGPDDRIQEGVDPVQTPGMKPFMLVDPDHTEGRTVTYTWKPKEGFKEILLERLAGASKSEPAL